MAVSQDPTPTPPLSRAAITSAAIEFIERSGIEKLSMRVLASELGCGTMSLYSHVRNRDDLISAIVQELLERSGLLEVADAEYPNWHERAIAALLAYKALAAAYPAAFELLALAPYETAPVAGHLERLVESLHREGLPLARAYEILGMLDAYATGFLIVWTRTQSRPPAANTVASRHLTSQRDLDAFDRGLHTILAGIERTGLGEPTHE